MLLDFSTRRENLDQKGDQALITSVIKKIKTLSNPFLEPVINNS